MTDKNTPSEIDDAELDMVGGVSPDMKIRAASTSGQLDADRKLGVRYNGVRAKGVRVGGLRDNGIRVPGVRKKG